MNDLPRPAATGPGAPPPGAAPAQPGWQAFTLQRPGGVALRLADLGASWLSCQVPLPGGERREVLLGNDDLQAQRAQRAYLGATIGRYANRIGRARFVLDGREVHLLPNGNGHQLHGGPEGFDKRHWRLCTRTAHHAVFELRSPAGDQGFPGAVQALVAYHLPRDGMGVEIRFSAQVSEPTPLALTNHAYFNLDGRLSDVREHALQIASDAYVPVDAHLIPCADPQPVAGTDFDFTRLQPIARRFGESEQQRLAGGYDHAWLLHATARHTLHPAAELRSSDGRLTARLYTDQPALQVYTGNHLAGEPTRWGPCIPHAGVALEPGLPPDAPNRPHWPAAAGVIVRPGMPWQARMRWQFLTTD